MYVCMYVYVYVYSVCVCVYVNSGNAIVQVKGLTTQ